MNKQELIKELEEELENIKWDERDENYNAYSNGKEMAYTVAIDVAKQLDEPKKVIKVSREFDEWVQKAKTAYCSADLWKEWCIYQINQMGWGQWLQVPVACKDIEDSYGHHPEWTREIHGNKELHTRAILDGYEVENEQLYYVDFIKNDDVHKRLVFDHENGKYNIVDWSDNLIGLVQEIFTEQEIKSIDERYWDFVVKVDGE
ncbi:DUF1642 domain-containing protein [Enterococcus faecalis]|nr:DUF1642 domain-containing protein [Enterococcus faecalis]EJJ1065460.1 DUF1642 domain-containing protein [Enterococcus faecalis]